MIALNTHRTGRNTPFTDQIASARPRRSIAVTSRRIESLSAGSKSLTVTQANRSFTNMFKGLALSLTLIVAGMIGAPALIIALV